MRVPVAPALLLVGALASALRAQDPLVLRPSDAPRVWIQGDPSWSSDFDPAEDGTALVHPAELVPVAGRPFAEAKSELLRAYQRELVNAAVTITPLVRIVGRRSRWAQNTPVLLGALGSVTATVIASIGPKPLVRA